MMDVASFSTDVAPDQTTTDSPLLSNPLAVSTTSSESDFSHCGGSSYKNLWTHPITTQAMYCTFTRIRVTIMAVGKQ